MKAVKKEENKLGGGGGRKKEEYNEIEAYWETAQSS